MALAEPVKSRTEPMQNVTEGNKPRISLAASGTVAAIKFGSLCHSFCEWAEVRAVATKSSMHFIDKASLLRDIILYTDDILSFTNGLMQWSLHPSLQIHLPGDNSPKSNYPWCSEGEPDCWGDCVIAC